MEIVGEDGSIFKLKDDGFKAAFGRGSGFNTTDRTVSRRHILFQLNQTEPRVSFQVVGKNPLWLRSGGGERKKITAFRQLEKGEIGPGDSFCISSQIPVWFSLKEIGENWGNVDISRIDPVKEFGFLVIGHEFDCYPNNRIWDAKNWDWILEETRQDDDGSDDEKKRRRRKRKKDEDDEWSDENEDIETTTKLKKGSRPKYMTRSKDKNKPSKSKERRKDSSRMKIDEKDDEEDETLGGFIVKDEDEEEETENDNEEEEEEEELMEDEEDEE